ncbi:MAG: glycoside hydrolase family 78 protein [Anaerolinea sp.]|nr:glycoside hydrolase family 78 protein [Anaerolinea sp.]
MSETKITRLICEYRTNPLGIDVQQPRLGWQMQTTRIGARQIAYQIRAASTLETLEHADLWDSGRVERDQSVHVVYGGLPLQSRQRVYWNVTVWDETGASITSDPAWFEMGLLKADDWRAQWIGAAFAGGARSTFPPPYLRKTFTLPANATSARLYVTALGLFECSINAQTVGKDVFAPGWTDTHKRVQVLTYDVTGLLQTGENVIGAVLGDGWAVGYVGWLHRQNYFDRPQLLAQLEITLTDGSTRTIASDSSWAYQFGPITHSDLIMGEAYDARREIPGWDTPGFDASQWLPAASFTHPDIQCVALNGPTVRRIKEMPPITDPINQRTMGRKRWLFDLGQNMVGRVRFKGSAPAGTTIIIRYAEILNADGTPYYINLRSAHATDYYTFKGGGEEVWESKFTFHGFRYVEIEGYPNEVTRDTITGIVLHSDMALTGSFECSDPLLNQLQRNIQWGQRGNFVDIPTDCPQRDERLGWTGDIQVFVRTAAFNMNVAGFMTKWVHDVDDAQRADGSIPAVVPYATDVPTDGGPAWADAAIICPWTIYQCYGDTRILEQSYATMTRFMDFLIANSPGLVRCAPDWDGWPGFGDWLSINASTPRDLLGTAFLAYDARLMSEIAAVLGKTDDAARYRTLFEAVKSVFASRYCVGSAIPAVPVVPSEIRRQMDEADALSRGNLQAVDYGAITSMVFNTDLFEPTQTAYVLALYFDLLPDDLRLLAAQELVADIERRGMHLSTGFVGSPYLNHVLSENGHLDTAYQLLHQKSWPSWLYAVAQGATTIWERWDGWTPERGFQTPNMNSFNHYAYGAIGAWLYNTVAGIDLDPSAPGYKHTILRPQPGGGLSYASGKIDTLYGELVSAWNLAEGHFEWTVVVPPNTTASLHIPNEVVDVETVTLNGEKTRGWAHTVPSGKYALRARTRTTTVTAEKS